MKKVVALMGSPRKNGNTSNLIKEIIRGAEKSGAETKVFNLIDMNIKPCQACYYCRKHESCSIKDDMQELYESIKDADAIIIGSPIYMFQVTGQMKQLMDRLYPLLSGENGIYQLRYGRKKTVAVYSHGAPEGSFKEYLIHNKKSLGLLGLDVVDTVICDMANDPRTALNRNELLETAYTIGGNLTNSTKFTK